jgi:hypothetical protein
MRPFRRYQSILTIMPILLLAAPAGAQEATPPEKSAFQQVFPVPTGKNGYEELVLAGEMLKRSRLFEELEAAVPQTLSLRRRALSDPLVRQVRGLIQVGLAKPLVSPRVDLRPETLMPDLALIRGLGRLLRHEMYVSLADGRTSSAITTYEEMLRLCDATRGDAFLGGLVGAAVDRMGADMLARHSEQWTVRDCERLLAVVRARLSAPNPALLALETERRSLTGYLKTLEDSEPTKDAFANLGLDEEDDLNYRVLRDALENPNTRLALLQEARAQLSAHWDRIAARIADPTLPPAPRFLPHTLGDRFADVFMVPENGIIAALTRNRVEIQLLGVHALIRKYRWEHDKLPDSLDELKARGLDIDPCTGKPLVYKKTGEATYELASAGMASEANGLRSPITVPFRRAPSP